VDPNTWEANRRDALADRKTQWLREFIGLNVDCRSAVLPELTEKGLKAPSMQNLNSSIPDQFHDSPAIDG
jgi:hypothetical protein